MSTALNHMKRSHRSQQGRYYAGMARYKVAVSRQNSAGGGYLGYLAKLFRRSRETKKEFISARHLEITSMIRALDGLCTKIGEKMEPFIYG